MAEPTLAEIAAAQRKTSDELKQMIKENNTGRSFITGDSGVLTGLIKDLTGVAITGVQAVATLAEKSMNNTATAADAFEAVRHSLSALGPGGRLAGDSLKYFADILTSSVDNFQKFSHEGLNFAGNAMAFREAVMRTGMSFQDFGDILDKIKPSMFQLGGGITGGLHAFAEISKVMNSEPMQVAFNTMGMLPKEANEVLALSIKLGRQNNINQDAAGREELALSTLKLSREMDAMAKLTGISRREQEKNIETLANDARVRARMSQLMNDPNKREGIGNIMANAKTLPPELAKAFAESIAGAGIMTSEKLSELNLTYGSKVASTFAEIGRLSNGTAEDQERAAQLTKDLMPLLIEGKRQQADYVRMMVNDTAMGREAHTNEAMFNYENTIAKIMMPKDKGGMGLDYDAARQEADARAKALTEGKLIENVMVRVGKEMVEIKAEKINGEYVSVDPTKYATQLATTAGSISRGIAQELNAGLLDVNNKMLEMEEVKNERGEIISYKFTADALKVISMANGASVGPDGKPKNTGNVLGEKFVGFIKDNTQALVDLPTGIANAFKGIAGAMGYDVITTDKPPEDKKEKSSELNIRSQSSAAPNINTVAVKELPAIAIATKETKDEVVALGEKFASQDKMAEQLEKISIIMASVKLSIDDVAGYTKKTASHTENMGGIVTT
jgi:hypothetical protein